MRRDEYDLVVIGGGAAGLGAARAAVHRGARTLLVSDGEPGGDCTFHGCVPSKTLIESARRGLPFSTAVQRVRDVVATIAATEDAATLRDEGIHVALARAAFTGQRRISVDGRPITARRFVVATGSRPSVPQIPGLASAGHLTNETVFDLTARPASLGVLGGGAVGCELAQAFARLGTRVTVIEAADRLLPDQDAQAAQVITAVFEAEGIDVRTGATVDHVANDLAGVRLRLTEGSDVVAERLLLAVGRRTDTDGLGLDAAGIRTGDRGHVVTDDRLATTAPGIFAAGDVTGRLLFTHAAFEMGHRAAGNALGRRRRPYRPHATPTVVFTDPEVAHVGLAEAEAAAHPGARVAYLPMTEMDRALTAGATDGFIKLIAGHRHVLRNLGGGRILGATIVAARAGELIHEPALAMATGMFTGRLAATTHAYPTWSYGVQLTAAQFFMTMGGRTARRLPDAAT
jgi:pyruvate/2-oxoglutarate dehydrogenase complex dihydrolipoamide dehydrogenase (E3) component